MKRKLVVILAVLLLLSTLSTVQAANTWKVVTERLPAVLTTGEAITIGQSVCIAAADGLVYKADSNASTRRPCIGFAQRGTAITTTIPIVTRGVLGGQSGLTPGAAVYLSETAGSITQSAPTDAQRVGIALTATTVYLDLGPPTATLTALADTKLWIGDGSSAPTAYTITGDATISNVGVLLISAATAGFTVGGGYGSTGATISTAGVGQFNGALTTDGVITALASTIKGQTVVAETTNARTCTSADYGKLIICSVNDAIAITLPANGAPAGTMIDLLITVDHANAAVISAATVDTLIGPNDVDLDSVNFATGHRIGAYARFISNGTYWVVVNLGTTTMGVTD